jgi:hypothetical protein
MRPPSGGRFLAGDEIEDAGFRAFEFRLAIARRTPNLLAEQPLPGLGRLTLACAERYSKPVPVSRVFAGGKSFAQRRSVLFLPIAHLCNPIPARGNPNRSPKPGS